MAKPAVARPSLKMLDMKAGTIKGAVKAAGGQGHTTHMIPIEQIKELKGLNIRITDTDSYQEDLDRLKRSIMRDGFWSTSPIACFASLDAEGDDVTYVTKGHRRLAAARLAMAEGAPGLEMLPVIYEPVNTDMVSLTIALDTENSLQRPPTPMEKAVVARRLKLAGLDAEAIAERLGITKRYVGDLDVLMSAPQAVRKLVTDGKVAANVAVKKLRKDQDGAADELQAMVDRAAESGRDKATPADEDDRPKIKMTREVIKYVGTEGSIVAWEDVERFAPFFPDEEWWVKTRSTKRVKLMETIEVTVTLRRPAKTPEPDAGEGDDAPEEGATEEQPAAPRKRRSRSAPAQADEQPGADDAPDLEALGIADRVTEDDDI